LRTILLWVWFVGFMMTDDAARGSTDFAVSRHVTSYPTDDCPFDASLGFYCAGTGESEQSGANDQSFHDVSPGLNARINPSRRAFVPRRSP
jgi:hypothetical protein